jgi:hypothetical protein
MDRQLILIDIPNGLEYGFPKIWNPKKNPSLKNWLIKSGYPKELLTINIMQKIVFKRQNA